MSDDATVSPGLLDFFRGVDRLVTKAGTTVDLRSALAGKDHVLVYVSAHWCPPCRAFTPQLAQFYKTLKASGKKIELVFVSWDNDAASQAAYHRDSHGDWLAVPFDRSDQRQQISGKCKANSIPTLVVLDKDGTVMNYGARMMVVRDAQGAGFPWQGVAAPAAGGVTPLQMVLIFIFIGFVIYRNFV